MKGFRVEGQQLGAAQTKTVAHPGESRHFGHASCIAGIASKNHNTHEDPRFGVPIPVTVGTFETKVMTLTRISGVYHGTPPSPARYASPRPPLWCGWWGCLRGLFNSPLVSLWCGVGCGFSGLVWFSV